MSFPRLLPFATFRNVLHAMALLVLTACASIHPGTASVFPIQAAASDKEISGPKDGVFISLAGLSSTVDGDFDGTSFVAGGGSAEVMPDLDSGKGWSFALGTRRGPAAIQIGYERSQFDGTFAGVPMDASLSALNFDFKIHIFPKARVQPHLLFGFGFPSIKVEGGSVGSGGRRADAKFSGIGARAGAGLSFYPDPHFGIFVEGGYRWSSFNRVSGIVDGELDDSVDGSGDFLALGATFTF